MRFVPAEALATTDKVILTVSKRVKSYAGIQMESDYSQEIAIEKEPKAVVASEIEVVYNETAEITVTVDPAEASTGKKVTATSVSSIIATIEPAEATLNKEGKATFTISGELPGQTMIQFAVEGMDMKPEVKVSVVEAGEKKSPATTPSLWLELVLYQRAGSESKRYTSSTRSHQRIRPHPKRTKRRTDEQK